MLLVEDSAGAARLMRIAFAERLGAARLDVIDDGERALQALTAGQPQWDVVMLDLNLPARPGHEILAAMRASADPCVRRLPVVVLSHSVAEADVLRSYELGANSHIAKPQSLEELLDLVEALGRYWLRLVALPS